jgi:hypothetical protein
VLFLEELINQHARVAGNIIAIDTQTWAILGTILVDGDVIMAEFDHWTRQGPPSTTQAGTCPAAKVRP